MSLQCLNTAAATTSKLDYSRFLENKQTQTLAKLTFGLLMKQPNEISEVKRESWKCNVILQTLNNLDSYLKFVLRFQITFSILSSPGVGENIVQNLERKMASNISVQVLR